MDGVASVGIGFLLLGMAGLLMMETHGLLSGEAADPDIVACIRDIAYGEVAVRHVNEVLTQHLGPNDVLVNLSLDVADDRGGHEREGLVTRIERRLKAEHGSVRRVFIEIQSRSDSQRDAKVGAEA